MERRRFIVQTVSASSLLMLDTTAVFATSEKTEKLVILHTNDVHSHIDPFATNDPKYPGKGGVAKRAALIDTIRKENEHVLLLDSGDIFQGTPYFNFYGGELEFKLMSMMGYDVATVGNHDFDNGVVGFLKYIDRAKFAFVNSNYSIESAELKQVLHPYKIIKKGNLKIGVFGVGIDLNGLVDEKNYKGVSYNDPIAVSNEMTTHLKHKGCNLVICLSHLGYSYRDSKVSDVVLATKTKGIHVILGGHTHTFLDKPTIVNNLEDAPVLVNQVGCFGVQLGRLDFAFAEGKSTAKPAIISV